MKKKLAKYLRTQNAISVGWLVFNLLSPASGTAAETPLKAKIVTSLGTIEVQLDAERMPRTVSNFVQLARSGFYNDMPFYRYAPAYAVQIGDAVPTGADAGFSAGYCIASERVLDLKHDQAGQLTMATTGAATENGVAGGAFFLTLSALPHLDARQSPFGWLVSGEDVLTALAKERVAGTLAQQKIERIEVEGTFKTIDVPRTLELRRSELEAKLQTPLKNLLSSIGRGMALGAIEQIEIDHIRTQCARSQAAYLVNYAQAKDQRLLVYVTAAGSTVEDATVTIEQFQFGRDTLP